MYDKKAEKKFRDLIEKFIEWLKNAESESDDDSSSDDDNSNKDNKDEEENKEEEAPKKSQ